MIAAVGLDGITIEVENDAAAAEPGLTVDVEIGTGGAFSVGEGGPESVNEPADGASGFVEINNVIGDGELGIFGIFGRGAVESGDEISGLSDVTTESFVDVLIMRSVVAPATVEFVLMRENGVIGGVDTEAVGRMLCRL